MKEKYSLMSLFTGAGGLDLGFKMDGRYRLEFANEILAASARTYSKNFNASMAEPNSFLDKTGHVIVVGDVENIDFSSFSPYRYDVIIGGPPCQDFSVLRGKDERKGVEVKRGRLYSHFVRALVHLKPKIFVFENVPGLASANRGTAYKTIREDFKDLSIRWEEVKNLVKNGTEIDKKVGYDLIFSDIVEFSRLGVPEKRNRLIIIGIREDLIQDIDIFSYERIKQSLTKELKGENMMFKDFPLTPLEVFEGRRLDILQITYQNIIKKYREVADEVRTAKAFEWTDKVWNNLKFEIIEDYIFLNRSKQPYPNFSSASINNAMIEHENVLSLLGYLNKPVENAEFLDGSNRIPNEKQEVLERIRRIPPGENHEFVKGTKWEVKALMSNIYRRVNPLQPAPTVIAYGGGGTWNYHYEKMRSRLTNRERARIQTFPDWFLFEGKTQEIRAQIGEAVPPLASYRIANALAFVLSSLDKN